jgi:Spy/CpxP family protein refolding chaperone
MIQIVCAKKFDKSSAKHLFHLSKVAQLNQRLSSKRVERGIQMFGQPFEPSIEQGQHYKHL